MPGLEASRSAAEIAPIAGLPFKLPSASPLYHFPPGGVFLACGSDLQPQMATERSGSTGPENGFADLSAMLEFTVVNNSAANGLKPLSAYGACFFSECRLLLSGIGAERIGGGGCSYGRIVEAFQRGLPSAKRVEDAGTGLGIKTGLADDPLKLAQGGILESNSIAPKNNGVNEKKSLSQTTPGACEPAFVSSLGLSHRKRGLL